MPGPSCTPPGLHTDTRTRAHTLSYTHLCEVAAEHREVFHVVVVNEHARVTEHAVLYLCRVGRDVCARSHNATISTLTARRAAQVYQHALTRLYREHAPLSRARACSLCAGRPYQALAWVDEVEQLHANTHAYTESMSIMEHERNPTQPSSLHTQTRYTHFQIHILLLLTALMQHISVSRYRLAHTHRPC